MTYENYNKNYMNDNLILQEGGGLFSATKQPTWTGYWQPDDDSNVCMNCNQEFKPTCSSSGKHHCRFGGELICCNCIVHISHIPFHFEDKPSNYPEPEDIPPHNGTAVCNTGQFIICKHHYNKFFKKCKSCKEEISKDDICSFQYQNCIKRIIWPIHKHCSDIEKNKYSNCLQKITMLVMSISDHLTFGFSGDINDYFSPFKNPNIKHHTFSGAYYSHQNYNRTPFFSIPSIGKHGKYGRYPSTLFIHYIQNINIYIKQLENILSVEQLYSAIHKLYNSVKIYLNKIKILLRDARGQLKTNRDNLSELHELTEPSQNGGSPDEFFTEEDIHSEDEVYSEEDDHISERDEFPEHLTEDIQLIQNYKSWNTELNKYKNSLQSLLEKNDPNIDIKSHILLLKDKARALIDTVQLQMNTTLLSLKQLQELYDTIWTRVNPTAAHTSTWLYLGHKFTSEEYDKLNDY